MKNERELETFAVVVHAVLASFHFLGLVYNVRRRSVFDSVAHGAALIYDSWATFKHAQRLTNPNQKGETQ